MDFKAAKQSFAAALSDSRPIYWAHMLSVSLQPMAVFCYWDAWLPYLIAYISTDASMPAGRLLRCRSDSAGLFIILTLHKHNVAFNWQTNGFWVCQPVGQLWSEGVRSGCLCVCVYMNVWKHVGVCACCQSNLGLIAKAIIHWRLIYGYFPSNNQLTSFFHSEYCLSQEPSWT